MRQKFGQNFLVDKTVAERIISLLPLQTNSNVVEIGPGKGILTGILAQRDINLSAVELDRNLVSILKSRFATKPNVSIINEDFLKFDIGALKTPLIFVSNLPYNVSTPIIRKVLPFSGWDTAVFMVQKEVGERIIASPKTSSFGSFSLLCQYYASVSIEFTVFPKSFFPVPMVDSVVLAFKNKHPGEPVKGLFEVINNSFAHRRKTLLNSLMLTTSASKEDLASILGQIGIPLKARAQELTITDFFRLTTALKSSNISL